MQDSRGENGGETATAVLFISQSASVLANGNPPALGQPMWISKY